MAMEMASCARAFVTSTPCCRSVRASPILSAQASAKLSSLPYHFIPLFCSGVDRNLSDSSRSSSSIIACLSPFPQRFPDPKSYSKRGFFLCSAVESNSTSSSTTADAEFPSADQEQEADSSKASADVEEQEGLGKALSKVRQDRVASGEENPSKTEEFWRGVLEETQRIEWPSLQKVLGTTGVVTSIIVGASLVLLTVNALLAQLSDAFFKNAPPS